MSEWQDLITRLLELHPPSPTPRQSILKQHMDTLWERQQAREKKRREAQARYRASKPGRLAIPRPAPVPDWTEHPAFIAERIIARERGYILTEKEMGLPEEYR